MHWSWPFRRFTVSGNSMTPAFRDGAIVTAWRWGKIQIGDVVVFSKGGLTMIKRATEREPNGWIVRGDNPSQSTDSLDFGTVHDGDIIGIVIARSSDIRRSDEAISS